MRRVHRVAAHLHPCAAGDSAPPPQNEGRSEGAGEQPEEEPWRDHDPDVDPVLGSLEGASPALRCWTVAQLGTASQTGRAPAEFPDALPGTHPAVAQFRKYGYVAVMDAVHPAALERIRAAFKAKQPHARAVYEASIAADDEAGEEHRASRTYSQMFDLPREDMVRRSISFLTAILSVI
jgi:hypothetical protein